MSVEALSAVLNHSEATGNARNVLMALANRADEHGICWPGVADLAKRSKCGPRTVQRQLRKLEELGELEVLLGGGGGRGKTPLYWIKLPTLDGEVAPDHPHYLRLRENGKGDRLTPISGAVKGDSPDTDTEPKRVTDQAIKGDNPGSKRVTAVTPETSIGNVNEPSTNKRPGQGPASVGKKAVTDREREIAQAALDAFNAQLKSSYTPLGYFAPIIRRIREEPDLGPSDHAGLVEVSFRKPWWSNEERPTPKVIYGNRAVFEGALERWKYAGEPVQVRAHNERSLTDAQQEKWDQAMAMIARSLPESTYQIWIAPLVAASATEDSVVALAPARISGWVERRYSGLLADALSKAVGRPMRVEVKTATFIGDEPPIEPPRGS